MAKYKRRYNKNSNNKSYNRALNLEKEIETLESRIHDETPDRGYAPPLEQQVAFSALPISQATLAGLDSQKFTTMTAIQNACIPHALCGRDVLGAARTGSGKTLAFLIPTLEKLYRARYSDEVGALLLSPTRELAVQIYQVLRKIGAYHDLSAGLVVGGKKEFRLEQQHICTTNIIVATPGRILQHLEQTSDLDCSTVLMLVLDEADRILDMGFREQMVRILEYLPSGERQTLLFSATQTRKVSDLAALSLHKPEYLGVHDKAKSSTPETLVQSLVTVPLQHKLNMVYSFVKTHLKCKTILFMASCSQVRFVWQLFCALQPGIPVMALHGKLNQTKRIKIYFELLQRPYAVLFATDVAARGLDFEAVDWVVQVDAPEDKDMYIHRVGRTARFHKPGKSLLCVTPSEEACMMELLQQARVPFKKLAVNPTKTVLVTQRAASLVASDTNLHTLAKKAFKSHVRSIHLQPNKNMFRVEDLPLDDFATSLGLASTPNLQFLKKVKDRQELRKTKNVNHKLHKLKEQIKAEKLQKKIAKLKNKEKAEGGDSEAIKKIKKRERDNNDDESEEENDLLVVKKRHEWGQKDDDDDEANLPDAHVHEVTKSRHKKRICIDGSNLKNKRIVFGEDGQEEDPGFIKNETQQEDIAKAKESLESAMEQNVQRVRERLKSSMQQDRMEEKERIREAHKKKRNKQKGEKEESEEMMVTLGSPQEYSEEEDGDVVSSVEVSGSSDEDEDNDNQLDVKTQEEMALAMIRNNL